MAEKRPGSHKRSKSALARSLLHRDKYKAESGDDDKSTTGSDVDSDTGSPISRTASPLDGSRSSHPKQQPTNLKPPTSQPSNTSVADTSKYGATGLQTAEDTIEQSVRKFKLFEILRSGDETAVTQAVRETSAIPQTSIVGEDSDRSRKPLAGPLKGTTLLHLAIQCAEPAVVERILAVAKSTSHISFDVNARDREGNTSLHLASILGRPSIVRMLLEQKDINDALPNYQGRSALDLARTPEIFQQLQLFRSIYIDAKVREVRELVKINAYEELEQLLEDSRVESVLDVNSAELAGDLDTVQSGGTLLHEAARKKDLRLIQLLLMHGADPFRRDRKGKLPQDITKDDRTRNILKRSPAAAAAQRGIQEKAVLGSGPSPGGESTPGGKEAREMRGYLKKWTNYTSGYKLRWFVLEDGVLSYYKHQDDTGSACRGAINMKIATLHMDPQDKTKFEIQGKSSVKYHLKANHAVEAKRWFWTLTNAIQWTKDEAKEEQRQKQRQAEQLRKAKLGEGTLRTDEASSNRGAISGGTPLSTTTSRVSFQDARLGSPNVTGNDASSMKSYEESFTAKEATQTANEISATIVAGGSDDEDADEISIHEEQPTNKDTFEISAHSASFQLSLLAQVSAALKLESSKSPSTPVSDPTVAQAISAYDSAVRSLQGLVEDLLRISRDRDKYWQYQLDREADARRMWEESMAQVVREQEALEGRIGESEDKRKRTKRALREVLENTSLPPSRPSRLSNQRASEDQRLVQNVSEELRSGDDVHFPSRRKSVGFRERGRRKSTITSLTNLSDSDTEENEEFFDAVDTGEVYLTELPPALPGPSPVSPNGDSRALEDLRKTKETEISSSFKGYEDPIRQQLKLDPNNRPPRSLWHILKSVIGQDLSKVTLPVTLNEPTSFLQRVTEDLEYSELLDTAADRPDSTERMLYVAAFAASEFASTIGRIAKPFNPLLGETYEYVRPDKGYRFVVEQVKHHPPVAAAWAESAKWDYFGESQVGTSFSGTSFDAKQLGTWFLRLRPSNGGTELYSWNKFDSSVTGIMTGNPTIEHHGTMKIKNHATGDICVLESKKQGFFAKNPYSISGKVFVSPGEESKDVRWSIGGKWNSKLLARWTPGVDKDKNLDLSSDQAFLLWQANPRPKNIPFNLTPFAVSFQSLPDRLKPLLPPTDTRFRPDQRAMEEGEWEKAKKNKEALESAQRARRVERKSLGLEGEPSPRWFVEAKCDVTGEDYWKCNGEYWTMRQKVADGGAWEGVIPIFETSKEDRASKLG